MPADPYPSPDPERHAFQIRLTVEEAGNADNFGRYRKTLLAYDNDGNLDGWPKASATGSVDEDLSPAPAARRRRASMTSTATTRSTCC